MRLRRRWNGRCAQVNWVYGAWAKSRVRGPEGLSTAFPRFESYRRINEPRPEERALARVSKDGHKRDRAGGHPSRRRFAPPEDEVCGFKLHPPDPIGFMESIDYNGATIPDGEWILARTVAQRSAQ
jgi:hypothetical protein